MATQNLIPVITPEGNLARVPHDNLSEALKPENGFKLAVSVTSPEGKAAWVPNDKAHDAISQGFKLGPPEQQPDPTVGTAYEGDARLGKGVIDAAKGLIHLPGQVFHAFTDPVQPGETIDPLQSPVDRGIKRLVFDPMSQELAKGRQEMAKGNTSEAIGHSVAGAIPLVGPFAAHSGEAIGQDPLRGGAELLTNLAAPKVLGETVKAASPIVKPVLNAARSGLAERVVAPLVRKPVGATLEDAKFNRNPAQAITNEGLVGTRKQILSQAQNRVGQLSDAVDNTLQNHPNANAQINAEPVIDSAIDNAISAAKKTGNKATITRLENLREALKNEYGPISGSPLEINNLKRQVGQVASDLGAFKSTDPLEASAAGAMQDVYTGLKNAVNKQVPEVAPLNERISNLISAQTGLKRNMALAENGSILDSHTLFNAGAKLAKKSIGSAPVRTGVARILNAGQTLDVPQVSSGAQAIPASPAIASSPRPPAPSGGNPPTSAPQGVMDILKAPQQPVQSPAASPIQGVSDMLSGQVDRRTNLAMRKTVANMTPEERAQALLTSEKTGLPNRRAFDEAPQPKAVAMSDADGLKALNDKFGYDAGDALLKAKADALKEAGLDAYHLSGDEFAYRGASPAELKTKLENARQILKNKIISVEMNDGTVLKFKGADFSYGAAQDLPTAETALKSHKGQREASGERARGQLRSITQVRPEEGQANISGTAQASAGGNVQSSPQNPIAPSSITDVLSGRKAKKGRK